MQCRYPKETTSTYLFIHFTPEAAKLNLLICDIKVQLYPGSLAHTAACLKWQLLGKSNSIQTKERKN
jgi:hypothetical protein